MVIFWICGLWTKPKKMFHTNTCPRVLRFFFMLTSDINTKESRSHCGHQHRWPQDDCNAIGYCKFSPLKPNDSYRGPTAPLTSKYCISYIYSTNIGTEYFKHGIYSPFFSSSKCSLFHNSNVFCSRIIHILYTGCAKILKKFRHQKLTKHKQTFHNRCSKCPPCTVRHGAALLIL